MDTTLLNDGVFLMVIGMGTVFFFLTILIGAMSINEKILKIIGKYFPEEIPEVNRPKKKIDTKDEEIAVAIACAIRNTQKV